MNVNGKRIVDFCLDLVIRGTLFQHKDIQKLTCKSPDGETMYDLVRCSLLKNEKIHKEYSDRHRSCLRTSTSTCLTDVENRWNTLKNGSCKAAEATLKYQGGNMKEWITITEKT